jgi:hypothetical protein
MVSGDGLRRPLNAPGTVPLGYGAQPGVSNGVQFARQVIVFGPSGTVVGIFVYAPGTTPGHGNLPLVSITQSATDPYGNTVQPGVTSYAPAAFAELTGAVLAFFNNNAGGNTRVIVAPNPSGNGVAVQSTGVNPAVWEFDLPVKATAGTESAQTLITTDTWHDLRPLINSFTGTVAGFWPPQYWLRPDGSVEIFGSVGLPAAFNSVTWKVMPVGVPAVESYGWAAVVNNGGSAPGNSQGQYVSIDTSGNLQFHGLPAGSNPGPVLFRITYPLTSNPITS